ncbi:MAG: cytochrome P450, partial [Polymorphobacter sp.]
MTVPFPGYDNSTLDNRLVNPLNYADESVLGAYAELRATDPVHWTEPTGFRPFWSITRHADITAIAKQNDKFINR